MEIVRMKNKCAPTALDPTHFRSVVINCLFWCNQASVFAAVRVVHAAVVRQADEKHAHHYEYFRAKLYANHQKEFDYELEQMLSFFEELRVVPVLLSLLVLILQHGKGTELPVNRYELYKQAITFALRNALESKEDYQEAMRMLQHLALENQLYQRRVFSTTQVLQVLTAQELELWDRLQDDGDGIPLLKTLQVGPTPDDHLFEFCHLSLQEALCAQALIPEKGSGLWTEEKLHWLHVEMMKWLHVAYYTNTFRIGGEVLGRMLSQYFGFDLHLTYESTLWEALKLCKILEHNTTIRVFSFEGMCGCAWASQSLAFSFLPRKARSPCLAGGRVVAPQKGIVYSIGGRTPPP